MAWTNQIDFFLQEAYAAQPMNLIHVIKNCLSMEKKLIAQVESVSINT